MRFVILWRGNITRDVGAQVFWAPNKDAAVQMWTRRYKAIRTITAIEEKLDDGFADKRFHNRVAKSVLFV